MKKLGPGDTRQGRVVGVAVATEAGFAEYYPVGHEQGENLCKEDVAEWLSCELSTGAEKIGANIIYDLLFLHKMGVRTCGPYRDVQIAEPLINENRFKYDLDSIARQYFPDGKEDQEMDAWITQAFGKRDKKTGRWSLKDPKSYIWKAPPDVVRPYAIQDARLPIQIFKRQREELQAQGLWGVFDLECRLIPMLMAMRQRGVRVDVARAGAMLEELADRQAQLQAKLDVEADRHVDVWKVRDIFPVFDAVGLTYPRTPKTDVPSITADLLKATDHPIPRLILEVRKLDKLRSTFLQGSILERQIEGRIHCQFKQVRGEVGGAVSGRFSSAQPNLQFIPVRTEEGKMIRSIFVPEEGHDWVKLDYSQIEYRLIVHYAAMRSLDGASGVVERYGSEPDIDFHQMLADITGLSRQQAKTVNFGLAYGEGVDKLCKQLNLPRGDGQALLDNYHAKAPFIRTLSRDLTQIALRDKHVETLLGRRRHFNLWMTELPNGDFVLREQFSFGAKVAFAHTALNAVIQGSAADIMKKAMVDVWESGVCDVLGTPHLTVHDELDFSVPRTREGAEASAEVKRLMEQTASLSVPLKVDASQGKNWGECG